MSPAVRPRLLSIGCSPCTREVGAGEASRAGRRWWETDAPKECGIHCGIGTGGFEHELHALPAWARIGSAVELRGEAAEVALGRRRRCSSMVADPKRRGRLADLVAAVGEREVAGAEADALLELLELGLQSGRLRA